MRAVAPLAGPLALVLALWAGGAALADISSIRPMPRPEVIPNAPTATVKVINTGHSIEAVPLDGIRRSIRPSRRPDLASPSAEQAPAPAKGLLAKLLGPKKRPDKAPENAGKQPFAAQSASGSVCKDRAIRGIAIPAIRGAQKGCGVDNPVRVTEVAGVALSTPATLDCDTARALRQWVTDKLQPAFGGNKVVRLQVAAHYACRGRNNKKGARISEHGRGKAIDIAGFTLANGTQLTVLKDYKPNSGKPIRKAHKGACGIFGTTLGPGSDGYHRDHLHLDTARYRGGPYCK